jgi:hypothetical protein
MLARTSLAYGIQSLSCAMPLNGNLLTPRLFSSAAALGSYCHNIPLAHGSKILETSVTLESIPSQSCK